GERAARQRFIERARWRVGMDADRAEISAKGGFHAASEGVWQWLAGTTRMLNAGRDIVGRDGGLRGGPDDDRCAGIPALKVSRYLVGRRRPWHDLGSHAFRFTLSGVARRAQPERCLDGGMSRRTLEEPPSDAIAIRALDLEHFKGPQLAG